MTGELVALNPADVQALAPAMREVAISTYLEHAKSWLATAVEHTSADLIAVAKAEIATAAEATKQLHLSKEIQLDAREMVRRAEYALAKAIKKGQADGVIETPSEAYRRATLIREVGKGRADPSALGDSIKLRPLDLASKSELHGTNGNVFDLIGVEPEEFDAALMEAKSDGDLSRANVIRKLKGQAGPITREQRADLIIDLAARGYTSRQMPAKVGVTEDTVRQIARDFGIDIPADKATHRSRRINSTDVVVKTATALEGW